MDSRYEVMMVADAYGNIANNPVAYDAFGRQRISSPLTLFDSSHRYADNDLWDEDTTGTASSTFNTDAGLIELDVGSASGDELLRETTKVFSYQPGKSLLVMTTFKFADAKTNLRQRVGYFGEDNGFYLELDDSTINLVERSSVTGSLVETRVAKENWNIDKLDGTGPSRITLDISKAQIIWLDMEWLGIGSVRMGFVIEGKFILCHAFHHANLIEGTYITTASLPLRQEITNTGATDSVSQAKQICATVISEGGYELRGRQHAIGTPITTPRDLGADDTYRPVITIRLKSARQDAIAILTAVSFLGITSAIYNWKIVASGTTSGGSGTWVSAGANSAVEYKLDATSISGGRDLASGWTQTTNQASARIDLLKEALFKFQLERNSFTNTSYELSFVVASDTDNADVHASLDWEEITR